MDSYNVIIIIYIYIYIGFFSKNFFGGLGAGNGDCLLSIDALVVDNLLFCLVF